MVKYLKTEVNIWCYQSRDKGNGTSENIIEKRELTGRQGIASIGDIMN